MTALARIREGLVRLGRRARSKEAAPEDRAASIRARAEAERRRDETYASSSRPPDASSGGPFAGL